MKNAIFRVIHLHKDIVDNYIFLTLNNFFILTGHLTHSMNYIQRLDMQGSSKLHKLWHRQYIHPSISGLDGKFKGALELPFDIHWFEKQNLPVEIVSKPNVELESHMMLDYIIY